MGDWDSEDFTPPAVIPTQKQVDNDSINRWEDEDKPEKVVPEDNNYAPKLLRSPKEPNAKAAKPKPSKLKAKAAAKTEVAKEPTDPTEKFEKVKKERELQEKSDLENAKDLFSGTGEPELKKDKLESFTPISEQDFEQFAHIIADKVVAYEDSAFYLNTLRNIIRFTTVNLKVEDVKELGKIINIIANEKIQKQKEADKKSKKKAGPIKKKLLKKI